MEIHQQAQNTSLFSNNLSLTTDTPNEPCKIFLPSTNDTTSLSIDTNSPLNSDKKASIPLNVKNYINKPRGLIKKVTESIGNFTKEYIATMSLGAIAFLFNLYIYSPISKVDDNTKDILACCSFLLALVVGLEFDKKI